MALRGDDARVATEPSRFVQRVVRVFETSQSDQCKRAAQLSVSKIRPTLRNRVVLNERSGQITARYCQGREADAIFERGRVGQKARTVRLLSTHQVAL